MLKRDDLLLHPTIRPTLHSTKSEVREDKEAGEEGLSEAWREGQAGRVEAEGEEEVGEKVPKPSLLNRLRRHRMKISALNTSSNLKLKDKSSIKHCPNSSALQQII